MGFFQYPKCSASPNQSHPQPEVKRVVALRTLAAIGVLQRDVYGSYSAPWLLGDHECSWSTVPHGIANDMFRYRAARRSVWSS